MWMLQWCGVVIATHTKLFRLPKAIKDLSGQNLECYLQVTGRALLTTCGCVNGCGLVAATSTELLLFVTPKTN